MNDLDDGKCDSSKDMDKNKPEERRNNQKCISSTQTSFVKETRKLVSEDQSKLLSRKLIHCKAVDDSSKGDGICTAYLDTQSNKEKLDGADSFNDNLFMELKSTSGAVPTSLHTNKVYKCAQCNSVFNQKCNLKRHIKLHSGYKPHVCKECGISFYEQDTLKKHTRIHTGEKPYKCEECGTAFAHSGHLKTHKRTHSGEKPFVCQECGLSFSQAGNLKVHKRIHTGEKPYVCKICGAAFSISCVFKKHKLVHTGERPFKCSCCSARFSSSSNLSRHNKIHTGEKPFKCHICKAAFPVKNSLDRHIKSHTGERPYCCEMCGAVFADMSDLTKHRKTHTGEKTLNCDICGMGFYSRTQMKIHTRTHTGEKPHKCLLCGMSFAQTGTLNKHKRTHTGEKPFSCDDCGTLFTAKGSLKKHKEKQSCSFVLSVSSAGGFVRYRNNEKHNSRLYELPNRTLSSNSMNSQEMLQIQSKALGMSLASSEEYNGLPVNAVSDNVNAKRTISVCSGNTSSAPPGNNSNLASLEMLDSSASQISGNRYCTYNSSMPPNVNTPVSETVPSSVRQPNLAVRSSQSFTFSDFHNGNECSENGRSSGVSSMGHPVSTTLHYL